MCKEEVQTDEAYLLAAVETQQSPLHDEVEMGQEAEEAWRSRVPHSYLVEENQGCVEGYKAPSLAEV